jgi:hypothetical protein
MEKDAVCQKDFSDEKAMFLNFLNSLSSSTH